MPPTVILMLALAIAAPVAAQPEPDDEPTPDAPAQVTVAPAADDDAIERRLQRILVATGWYDGPAVEVNDGIVFLRGATDRADRRQWAGDLARNTEAVVAVVNRIEVVDPPAWDFRPALAGLAALGANALRNLPYFLFSIVILLLAWSLALYATRGLRAGLRRRRMNALLRDVAARGAGIVVFIAGLYSVFHVAGLTNVALAVLGGTGLAGIALGIAFRDITENFLASIFLSAQNPFRSGDLIQVAGVQGFVQRMTTRATILMTLDGNHVQVPNATIYKSNIVNLTSNPNVRMEFDVAIAVDDSITRAQEAAMRVLAEHPDVLADPAPWVVAHEIRNATVVLKVSFWFNARQVNGLLLRSSLIRLVKRGFASAGIRISAERRDFVPAAVGDAAESDAPVTPAEARAEPDEVTIQRQAARAPPPEDGDDLLAT